MLRLALPVSSCCCFVLLLGCGAQKAGGERAAPAGAAPDMVVHVQDLPVVTAKQLEVLEARLEAMGFRACAFKDGPGVSGHSLMGQYENLDFTFRITRERRRPDAPESITVSSEAVAPSRRKAEEVSRHLITRLTASGDDVGGGGR